MIPTTRPKLTPVPPCDGSGASAIARLVEKLTDPDATFTSGQAAWLMSNAQRWGYETREAEENDEFASRAPVRVLGQWFDQAEARAEADVASALPRVNDYTGGPVSWVEEQAA